MSFDGSPFGPRTWKTPDEIDADEDNRTLHDAQLIEGGAKHKEGVLEPTSEQIKALHDEMLAEQFESSLESPTLVSRQALLQGLSRALGVYFNKQAGPLAGPDRDRLDAEYERAMQILSLPKPQTREEGVRLFHEVRERLDVLHHAASLLEHKPVSELGNRLTFSAVAEK